MALTTIQLSIFTKSPNGSAVAGKHVGAQSIIQASEGRFIRKLNTVYPDMNARATPLLRARAIVDIT
jgi:hypothetical protein